MVQIETPPSLTLHCQLPFCVCFEIKIFWSFHYRYALFSRCSIFSEYQASQIRYCYGCNLLSWCWVVVHSSVTMAIMSFLLRWDILLAGSMCVIVSTDKCLIQRPQHKVSVRSSLCCYARSWIFYLSHQLEDKAEYIWDDQTRARLPICYLSHWSVIASTLNCFRLMIGCFLEWPGTSSLSI